jgi:predicted Zn finger-like uncharacterized protein
MEIICEHCQAKLKIADDKIPQDRTTIVSCPKCKEKITIGNPSATLDTVDDASEEAYDDSGRSFSFAEEEGQTVLICEGDPEIRQQLTRDLELMEYFITVAESARDALKKMRYQTFNLIVINENFDAPNPDANGILIYLSRLSMDLRRKMFVTMISDRYRTMDRMMTLHRSVNLIINKKNIDEFERILVRGVADYDVFTKVFIDAYKKAGRM